VNDLSQSQKWPVGFYPSGEVVVWEHGDEIWDGDVRDSPYPLYVLPANMALDWEVDSVEDENPSLMILDAFEWDFFQEVKAARLKSKGRREILNLVSSNYGDASASTWHKKRQGLRAVAGNASWGFGFSLLLFLFFIIIIIIFLWLSFDGKRSENPLLLFSIFASWTPIKDGRYESSILEACMCALAQLF
jgi:hypothetical protein